MAMSAADLPSGSRPITDPSDPRREVPGHAVKADGSVWVWHARYKRWVELKPKTGRSGFVKVQVKIDGKRYQMGVASLVLRAFVGPRPLGYESLHFPDPDPANNRVQNLRWAKRGASKIGRQLEENARGQAPAR